MSMSHYVKGVRDLDAKFADMIQLKLACEKANISYPAELEEYFDGETCESEKYLRAQMEEMDLPDEAVKQLKLEYKDGYEVDISKLPKECKAIRFEISY